MMNDRTRQLAPLAFALLALGMIGCNSSSGNAATAPVFQAPPAASDSLKAVPHPHQKEALILALSGLSDVDAMSIASIAEANGMRYDIVSSAELDAMSAEELTSYGMILVGGGYGGQASQSLEPATRERVRRAVTEGGVGYVGFCAGTFMAVSPPANQSAGPDYGFSIVPAPQLLDYFYPFKDGNDDTAAAIPITFGDGTSRQLLFWGGPALPEVPGGVIARYEDGTPAAVQTRSGQGFVTLVGPHPEGPSDWKAQAGVSDPDGDDFEIAGRMLSSTLKRDPMPTL